jgi:hypothetical protein
MNYGFSEGRWYIDIPGLKRKVGNVREEHEFRAKEIYETYGKPLICLSSGLDSQVMIHSFFSQGIPFDCVFFNSGHNKVEYTQLQVLIEKYKLKPEIINLNPHDYKDQILKESKEYKIFPNQIFIKLFLSKLPDDANVLQSMHDPYVHVDSRTGEWQFFTGYNINEITRDRIFKTLNRKGNHIWYGDSSEFLYSIITDPTFLSGLYCHDYIKGTGLHKTKLGTDPIYLYTLDKWDYYIKPLLYGKYWKNELEYFPKYAGFEDIDFLSENGGGAFWVKERVALIPYHELIKNLESGIDSRYYENFHKPYVSNNN